MFLCCSVSHIGGMVQYQNAKPLSRFEPQERIPSAQTRLHRLSSKGASGDGAVWGAFQTVFDLNRFIALKAFNIISL